MTTALSKTYIAFKAYTSMLLLNTSITFIINLYIVIINLLI